jgi:hypothetical protein
MTAHLAKDLAVDLGAIVGTLDERDRAEVVGYWEYHARRYSSLVDLVLAQMPADGPAAPLRILDVGPNFQTALLRQAIPEAIVDTLGFEHPFFPPRDGERHIELDLTATEADDAPVGDGGHDVVVMGEVIEHLHTAPVVVLRYLAQWLHPGGMIVVQTPNAVALHKRMRMALGRNPYEPIRLSQKNPGHFHEYTVEELEHTAREAGLTPAGHFTGNYFGGPDRLHQAYAALGSALPERLRHGITMWMRRPCPPAGRRAAPARRGPPRGPRR